MRRRMLAIVLLTFALASLIATPLARAEPPATNAFQRTWARTDKPVADLATSRTWMWGPEANTTATTENYADAPDGQRTVQYFDKSRMEDNSFRASEPWDVTNGLLVLELMTGRLQLGDNSFEQHDPADVNVGGDANDPIGPTYSTMAAVRNWEPLADGALITQRIARGGAVTPNDPALAAYGVTAAHHVQVPGIDHQVASVFWTFMNSTGLVWEDGALQTAALFQNPFYATGYPVTEAYWAAILVGGQSRDVLLQCFERRCLTYTPGNPDGWKVEAGNVGQHYYTWRYVQIPAEQPATEGNYTVGAQWNAGSSSTDLLDGPWGVHVDASGDLFVADVYNDRVLKFDADGNYISWGPGGTGLTGLNEPSDVATDHLGNVYVADSGNQRVVIYNSGGNQLTHFGAYGGAEGEFESLDAIHIDTTNHEIYVVDMIQTRIQVFDLNGEFLRKWGSFGSGDGQFVSPKGVAIHDDDVYISDMNNHRVQQFDRSGNFIRLWGGDGSSGGKFHQPIGVATDASGNVYVADNSNGRIQIFTSTGEFIAVISGSGQLSFPRGVAVDSNGRVFVTSHGNDTIFRFDPGS